MLCRTWITEGKLNRPSNRGGRLVRIPHIAGWWVGHAFKSEMVSDTIWVGVLTILNDQNGIFYLKMPFFTKNLPIFTKKLHFFAKNLPFFTTKKYYFLLKKSLKFLLKK